MNDIDLINIIKRSGLINEEQIQRARQEQQESGDAIEDILLRHHAVEEDRLLDALSQALGVPWTEIPPKIQPSVINLVPAEFALRHCVLPLQQQNGSLTVAAVDPTDLQVFDDLRMLTGCEIEVVMARRKELLENIERYFGASIEKLIANLSTSDDDDIKISDNIEDLQELAREPTVVNLVNLIIFQAVQENASDIHIEPFTNELKVRYRIDGMLREMPPPPKHLQPAIVSRVKIMAEMDIAERYTPRTAISACAWRTGSSTSVFPPSPRSTERAWSCVSSIKPTCCWKSRIWVFTGRRKSNSCGCSTAATASSW